MVALTSILPLLATGFAVADAAGFLSKAKSCETADAYCAALVKNSQCLVASNNQGVCKGSKIPCRCVGVTDYNEYLIQDTTTTSAPSTTTPAPTTQSTTTTTTTTTAAPTTTTTTTTAPVTVKPTATPVGKCSDLPASAERMALWVEWPSGLGTEVADIQNFFTKVVGFTQQNCANLKTTKLIMRTNTPSFPEGNDADSKAYWPPASSPLYTHLLSQLDSSVEVHFYPYVMDALSEGAWMKFGSSPSLLKNIYSFANQWNDFLRSAKSPVLVKGIVLDNEEIRGWAHAAEVIGSASVTEAKGDLDFGVTIGFDETGSMNNWAGHVDEFYLQVYDLYTPEEGIDRTPNSRFLTLNGDAVAMANYIGDDVLTDKLWNVYEQFASKITLMWSNQNLNKNCIYPLNNGLCGVNNEFGSWTPKAFNAFMGEFAKKLATKISNGAQIEQAVFQFSFFTSSWFAA